MARERAIDIELAADRQTYLPGDAVTAFVRLNPREDLEDVECSVALVHIDRYPTGDSSYTDDRAVAGEYVLAEDALVAGATRELTAVLPVPRRIVPPDNPEDCADERFPLSGDDADPESYDSWIEPDERWGPPTSVGQPKDLAFAVEVPGDAGPSIVSEDYRVDWLVRAVIDRPLRRDEVWEQTIAVHTS